MTRTGPGRPRLSPSEARSVLVGRARRRRTSAGLFLVAAVGLGLLAVTGLVIYFSVLFSSFGDCFGSHPNDASEPVEVPLDLRHPTVLQPVTVAFNREAFPADGHRSMATLAAEVTWSALRGDDDRSAPVEPSLAEPPVVEVAFVRRDTGDEVSSRKITGYPVEAEAPPPAVALDCVPDRSCRRAFDVRLMWLNPVEDARLLARWSITAGVEYARSYSNCGGPSEANVVVDAAAPRLVEAAP